MFLPMGLPAEAETFLRRYRAKIIGQVEKKYKEDSHGFLIYLLEDGKIVEEYEQEQYWCNGPMIFFGLREKNSGKILFTWKTEDMEEHLPI